MSDPAMHRIKKGTILVSAAILIAGVLAFHGLTNHLFWDDEASTAIFGRNLLKTGKLTAWDGHNLIGYRGGAELDENLINVYMPPMQYYVAAAGLYLFGESTFGGRVLFVIAGLAGIALLAVFMRHLAPYGFPWWLPPLLLAATPAYLLYIRNCRYYSLGVLFTLAVLAASTSSLDTRRSWIIGWVIGLGSTAALIFTHYINAAAVIAFLPVLLLWPRFRTRRHLGLLGGIYGVAALCGVWIYLKANPLAAEVAYRDPTPAFERFLTLLWWHAKGLATFEFLPVLLIPAFTLPFLFRRLSDLRPLAAGGAALVGMIAISCVITALFSPQSLPGADLPDMRYQVPLIAIGAGIGGIGVFILWRALRPLGVIGVAILLFSNIFHLGFFGERSGLLRPRAVSCTLCQYVWENMNDYTTGTEMVVKRLGQIPDGSIVLVAPTSMAYAPMFYLPNLRYAGQLSKKEIRSAMASLLPDYLFVETARLDLALIRGHPPAINEGPLNVASGNKIYYMGRLKVIDDFPMFHEDRSRPEIPWHSFSPMEFEGVPGQGLFLAEVNR